MRVFIRVWLIVLAFWAVPPVTASAQSANDVFNLLDRVLRQVPDTGDRPPPVDRTAPQPDRRVTPAEPAPRYQAPRYARADVRETQRMLNELGYDAGPVDGAYGRRTRRALIAFQQDQGLPADGDISDRVLTRLRQSTGRTQAGGAPALGQGGCTAIRFAPGTSAADITGVAPVDGVLCYTLATLSGQIASIEVIEGNVSFSIAGFADAVDYVEFTTEHKTYEIVVGQAGGAGALFQIHVGVTGAARAALSAEGRWIAEAQQLLNRLGYPAGPADGKMGPATRRAIGDFQRDSGLGVTGRLDHDGYLISALRTAQTGGAASGGGSVAQSPGDGLVAQPPGGGGGVFNVDFLAPEGIRMGMPVREARAALESRGYTLRQVGHCDFELPRSSHGHTGVVLGLREPQIRSLRECPDDDTMVIRVSYQQQGDQAPRPIEPEAELQRIVRQIGKYNECPVQTSRQVDCIWASVASDPAIGQIRIGINTAGHRNINITADLLEILPVVSERQQNVQSMEMQALHICKNYNQGGGGADMFRVLHDCSCIAKKMGQAYSKGLIGEPSPSNLSKYGDRCPADRESLRAYFENRCIASFGTSSDTERKAWALDGGCVCVGYKAADQHIATPITTISGLGGAVSSGATACNYGKGRAPVMAGASSESSSAAAERTEEIPSYTSFAEVPAGIRPLNLWLKNGRPVVYKEYRAVTTMDRTFDYRAQEEAIPRLIDLMLLARDPSLIGENDADRVLAGDNLSKAERDRLMKDCFPPFGSYCNWAGNDEFEVRMNKEEFRNRFAPLLSQIKINSHQEIIFVEHIKLGEYSTERGGFPISFVRDTLDNFYISKGIIGGRSNTGAIGRPVTLKRDISLLPEVWSLSPSEAEAFLRSSGRFVQIAWTYRISDIIELPESDYEVSKYALMAEAISASLYLDARLTEFLFEVPIHGEAVTPPSSSITASPTIDRSYPTAVLRKPGPLTEPHIFGASDSGSKNVAGFVNLLILGEQPELVHDPRAAMILAHENFVGLTNSTKEWSGTNEFEISRSKAAFSEVYGNQVVAMAPRLPQEILIRLRPQLGEYDFDRHGFPISWGRSSNYRTTDDIFTLRSPFNIILSTSVFVGLEWENGSLPEYWPIEPREAQELMKKMNELGVWKGKYRTTNVEIRVRLAEMMANDKSVIFVSDILEIGVYSDRKYSQRIATWEPLAPGLRP